MITCQVENLTERLEELKPLLLEHWREIALDQDKVPLQPNWDLYRQNDAAGRVSFTTVREDGQLRGYFVGFIAPGIHYATTLECRMDIFWLHPDLRDGDSLTQVEFDVVADALFDAMEEEARRRGVKRIYVGCKLHKDVAEFFARRGYVEIERYHSLWIGG